MSMWFLIWSWLCCEWRQGGPNGAPMGHVFSPFAAAGGGSPYAAYTPQPAAPSSQYPLHAAPPPPPPHQVGAGPPPPRHPHHQPPSQQQQPPPLPRVPHLDNQSPGMIQHCSVPSSGTHGDYKSLRISAGSTYSRTLSTPLRNWHLGPVSPTTVSD